MPVSIGLAPPLSPSSTSFTRRSDMKLSVHLMRCGLISSASIRLPMCASLTLLDADLTSVNTAPATFFSVRTYWVRFMMIASASA